MRAARTKAPSLAWLLTALTCLLAGMAIVESRSQVVALPPPGGTRPPVGVAETGAVADPPTRTPTLAPTASLGSGEPPAPPPIPRVDDVLVPPSGGPADLRVTRLTVPPSVALPPEVAPGPTVLLVESGVLSVRVDSVVFVGQGLEPTQVDAALATGERLVIAPGARYAVRNDGPTPAEALVVAIVPVETPTPMLGPGEPLPWRAA